MRIRNPLSLRLSSRHLPGQTIASLLLALGLSWGVPAAALETATATESPSAVTAAAAATNDAVTPPAIHYQYGDATGDILMADMVGFGLTFSAVGLNFLGGAVLGADGTTSAQDQLIASAITELSSVNLFVAGSPDALPLALAGGLLWGAEALAIGEYGLFSREQQWVYWAKNNLAMYRAYDGYASIRSRSPAWNNSVFRRHSVHELMLEPFRLENYAEPLLWGAVGVTLASVAGQWLVSANPLATTPGQTGEWYLGEKKVKPEGYWLNNSLYFLTANTLGAIGEEGVYRGVLHEELGVRFGKNAATIIDSSAFALMHLVTDIARGMSWDKTLIHVSGVTLNNLLFDAAYDKGGLPLAVAVHAVSNFAANILVSCLYAGVPLSRSTN